MKKKLVSILLCIVAVASMTACGKRVDMEALKEEVRQEVLAEMKEEQEKAEREAAREARRDQKETEDEEKENEGIDEEKPVSTPSTQTKEPVAGPVDWSSMTFTLDGTEYTIPFNYDGLESEWTFDLADYGYEDGYVLNPNEYIYATVDLEHAVYDCRFYIGLENNTNEILDIKDCDVWSVSIDTDWADSYPDIELPGGITWGSSLAEVEAAYGIPEDTYRAEDLGYTVYNYNMDYTYYMSLTIYDEEGVTSFDYKVY